MSLIDDLETLLDDLTPTRHDQSVSCKKGVRVATASPHNGLDDQIFLVLEMDYGPDGKVFCESTTYRSARGAARKIRGFLN